MKTTADFLDALRAKLDLPSDGRLADYLGMHRQHVSRYRTLGGTFDDEMALRIADILETDPAYVIACMHAQREKNAAVKKVWEHMATLALSAAAVVTVLAFLPLIQLPVGDVGIIANPEPTGALYIMSNAVCEYWYAFAALAALAFWARPRQNPAPK